MAELPVIEIQPQDFSEIDQLRGSLSRGEAFSLILKHFLDDPAAVQALVTAGQTSEDKSPAAIDFEQSFQDLEAMMDDPDLDPPGPGTDTGDFPGLQSDAGQLEVDDFPGLPGAQDQTGEDDFPGVPYTQGQTAEDDFPGLPQSQADTEDFTAPTEGPCAADDDDFPGIPETQSAGSDGLSEAELELFPSSPEDDVDPSQIFGGPAFKDNGDPVEPGDVKKPSRKPMPQSLTSIIQNMVNSAVEDDEDDQTDSDEDAEAGNFWDFEEGQSSGWGGRDPDKVIGAGDIITYRKLTDMEGVPPKSILLREVDRPVDPLQIERSINLDAKTVQTYQRAGKALLGAAVGEHVMLDIPGQDPVTIEILSLMKPEKK